MGLAECAQVVVPEATELAMRYYHSGNIIWIVNQLLSIGIPLFFLMTRWSANTSLLAQRVGRKWFFHIAIYLIIFTLFYYAIDFPLDLYTGYFREHAYGLSTQSSKAWLDSYGKGLLISIINAVAFVWIFYLLLKRSPKRWWFYGSLASIAISFVTVLVQPIWIDPLFNTFSPMKDQQLEKAILDLASKAGIEKARVYEVDKSKETRIANAYVTGIGSTSRIVLWDTAIQQLSRDQLLFVMGHEMGHYVLHHIWWYLAYFSLITFVLFYLVYKISNYLFKKYHKAWRLKALSDIASLPLFLTLMTFFMFLSLPLFNVISRHMEHEADQFGLEITQNNTAMAEAFIVLQQKNLANPRPGELYKIWRSSHPPLAERVEFANSYCPWRKSEPMRYEESFQQNRLQ